MDSWFSSFHLNSTPMHTLRFTSFSFLTEGYREVKLTFSCSVDLHYILMAGMDLLQGVALPDWGEKCSQIWAHCYFSLWNIPYLLTFNTPRRQINHTSPKDLRIWAASGFYDYFQTCHWFVELRASFCALDFQSCFAHQDVNITHPPAWLLSRR